METGIAKQSNSRRCKHKQHTGERLLAVTEFNRKGAGYQSYCRNCQKGYYHGHYDKNKEYYAEKRDSWRKACR